MAAGLRPTVLGVPEPLGAGQTGEGPTPPCAHRPRKLSKALAWQTIFITVALLLAVP